MAGTTTAHGFKTSPIRFSLIMMPQFAAGGAWPNPRNESPAMMTMEYVNRRPTSTIRGLITLGRISLAMILLRLTPKSSMAFTKSLSETSSAAERITRATCGACEKADGEDRQPQLRADDGYQKQSKDQLWEREDDVDGAHDHPVPPSPEVGGGDAAGTADGHAQCGRRGGHEQEHPAAVEYAGQYVATQLVAAQDGASRGRRERGDDAGRGRVGSNEGPDYGDSDDGTNYGQADPAPWQGRGPEEDRGPFVATPDRTAGRIRADGGHGAHV